MKLATLKQIGNSVGPIFDKTTLELVHADKDTVFEVKIEDGCIVYRPLSGTEMKKLVQKSRDKTNQKYAKLFQKLAK